MLPLIALILHSGPDLATLNQLAKARNVAALEAFLPKPLPVVSPFRVLRTGGPYEGGKYGWTVKGADDFDGRKLVVFTTPITMQDTGELVFVRDGDRLHYVPEDDRLGVRIVHHAMQLKFVPASKTAAVVDDVTFESSGGRRKSFLVRLANHYAVSKVTADGEAVPFRQAGGIVILPTPKATSFHYTLTYKGIVDLDAYAGCINASEASLADDYWYPSIARQAATYEVTMSAPKGWTCVAQGERVGPDHFRMDVPVVYFTASAAPYNIQSDVIDGRRFTSWAVGRPASEFKNQAALYAPILAFYERVFGKYPFTGYGDVVSKVYGGGALEAYSFATYGDYIPEEDAHETAHTWWGGIVPNSYLHSLWNESFAVFCEGLYQREVTIGDHDERRLAFISTPGVSEAYKDAPCAQSGVEIGPSASTLGYGKGAVVLQMLENRIGTPAMLATMKAFVDDRKTDRTAEWEDYEAAVRKIVGPSQDVFLQEWLHRPGYVDFQIKDVAYANGGISGTIAFNGEPYHLSIEALLQFADGSRTFATFDVGDNGAFAIPCSRQPSLVSIDPWMRLVRRIDANEAPVSIRSFPGGRVFRSSHSRPEYPGKPAADFDGNLKGAILVGDPDSFPAMAPLCKEAGFDIRGDELTYDGATIDLRTQTATAIVDLPTGGSCMIALGNSENPPNTGRARLCLTDHLGRFLRGVTEPKTSGSLTFRLTGSR